GLLRLIDESCEASSPALYSVQGVYELFELRPAPVSNDTDGCSAQQQLQRIVFIGQKLPPAEQLKDLFVDCQVCPVLFVRYYPDCEFRSLRALLWGCLAHRLLNLEGLPTTNSSANTATLNRGVDPASYCSLADYIAKVSSSISDRCIEDSNSGVSLSSRLAQSVLIAELLWCRPQETAKFSQERRRSLLFALYNRARAESLMQRAAGVSAPGGLDELAASSRSTDENSVWALAWGQLDTLVDLLAQCQTDLLLSNSADCCCYRDLNQLVHRLEQLCREFARFYHRVRVLPAADVSEPGSQLMTNKIMLVNKTAQWIDLLSRLIGIERVTSM
uniref:DALR_1 domain-containing protein n=1 Tax=Macrostomum lignano TaxID=282301 RepID=A0A1I8GBU5_9PLAT